MKPQPSNIEALSNLSPNGHEEAKHEKQQSLNFNPRVTHHQSTSIIGNFSLKSKINFIILLVN